MSTTTEMTVSYLLRRAAERFPDKTGMVYEDKRYTYREWDARVDQLCNGLKKREVSRSDRVAWLLFNGSQFLELYVAVNRMGAVGVPINFRLVGEELVFQLNDCGASVFVFDVAFLPVVNEIKARLSGVRHYVIVGATEVPPGVEDYEKLLEPEKAFTPEVDVASNDDFLIMYTSGTTGVPRGAIQTAGTIIWNAASIQMENWIDFDADDVMLHCTPLFHTGGSTPFVILLMVGATHIISKLPRPDLLLKLIQEEKVTASIGAPEIYRQMILHPEADRYDLSSLRFVITVGAPQMPDFQEAWQKKLPRVKLSEVYGSTEVSGGTTCMPPEHRFSKPSSCGKLIKNLDARFVDDAGNDVPLGEVGEIICRGPQIIKGYYHNPEATSETIVDGWLHTGDLARLDEDGFVYIVDRKKDMILSGGENIYPAEIEAVLNKHPKVLESAVIGVRDPKWGETPRAIVVPRPGEKLTEEEIIEYCKGYLASYKKPTSVVFVERLPRNPAGKILKTELREKYEQIIEGGDKS